MTRGVAAVLLLCSVTGALANETGCQGPEVFHRNAVDGAVSFGTGGEFASGGTGSGGVFSDTGGAGIGETGTGGAATGGVGTGGAATGGAATGGAATGGMGTGGAVTGGAGTAGRGGGAGTGAAGASGTAGGGGRGTGGMANGGGGMGVGGNTGTGPCMGLCAGATLVPPKVNSGPLGIGATCHEVVGTITGVVCGNFVAPRTFSVNGSIVACPASTANLPAKRNGGYCMQTSPGDYSYAYFNTY